MSGTQKFWSSFTDDESVTSLLAQRSVRAVPYCDAPIRHMFGLPVTFDTMGSKNDYWAASSSSTSTAKANDAPTALTRDLFGAVVEVLGLRYGFSGCSQTVRIEHGSLITVTDVTDRHHSTSPDTYDKLLNDHACVEFAIEWHKESQHAHPPMLVYAWIHAPTYRGDIVRFSLFETAFDYSPILRTWSNLGYIIKQIFALKTKDLQVTKADTTLASGPAEAVMLHDASLREVRACFDASGNEAKPTKGYAEKAAVLPLFMYASRLRDYHAAINSANSSKKTVPYTKYWYMRESLKYDGRYGAMCKVQMTGHKPNDIKPTTCVYLGTNAGQSITGCVNVVRVRDTGRYIFHVSRECSLPASLQEAYSYGVAQTIESPVLAGAYAVDNWGSLVTVKEDKTPRVVHTAVTQALRNSMLNVDSTVIAVVDIPEAIELLCTIFKRAGCKAEPTLVGALAAIKYELWDMHETGTILMVQRVHPSNRLHGVLSEWQTATVPGIVESSTPTLEHYCPIDDFGVYPALLDVDAGESMLGRFLLQEHVHDQVYLDLTGVLLPKRLREQGLLNEGQYSYIGQRSDSIDVVFDVEYSTVGKEGNVYPTAAGLTINAGGQRVSVNESMLDVDAQVAMREESQSGGNPVNLKSIDQMKRRDTAIDPIIPMMAILDKIAWHQHERDPGKLRLWAKGGDTEYIMLSNAADAIKADKDGHCFPPLKTLRKRTNWNRRRDSPYHELGPSIPKYHDLAKQHGINVAHRPGLETALFSRAAHMHRSAKFQHPDLTSDSALSSGIEQLLVLLHLDEDQEMLDKLAPIYDEYGWNLKESIQEAASALDGTKFYT